MVVAPGPGPSHHHGIPVTRVRSVGAAGLPVLPASGCPTRPSSSRWPASPRTSCTSRPRSSLGAAGLRAARRLGVPTVAVYQTDVARFARQYGVRADVLLDRWVGRLHRRADRTLVPSTVLARPARSGSAYRDLHLWGRGVSLDLFGPDAPRPGAARRALPTAGGTCWSGYVGPARRREGGPPAGRGRRDCPGTRLVVVGEGPEREWLGPPPPGRRTSPGRLRRQPTWRRPSPSLDVFVHPATHETFCQTVQEAQASGVPVVAAAAGGPLDLVDHGRTGLLFDPVRPAVAVARRRGRRTRRAAAGPARRRRPPAGAGPGLAADGRGSSWTTTTAPC